MTGTTTGQTSLPTATDSDDSEIFLTTSLVTAEQTLADKFDSTTGHNHSGSGQGGPIAAGSITAAMLASAITGAWTAFTPTVTQSGSVTVTVTAARYLVLGKIVLVQLLLAITGAGTAGNDITIGGIPAAIQPRMTGSFAVCGHGVVVDAGTANYPVAVIAVGTTTLKFVSHASTGYLGSSPSYALANTDTISATLSYELA